MAFRQARCLQASIDRYLGIGSETVVPDLAVGAVPHQKKDASDETDKRDQTYQDHEQQPPPTLADVMQSTHGKSHTKRNRPGSNEGDIENDDQDARGFLRILSNEPYHDAQHNHHRYHEQEVR